MTVTDPKELVTGAQERIDAIPETCGNIRTYMDEIVSPCLPFASSQAIQSETNMEDKNICCSAVNNGSLDLSSLVSEGIGVINRPECLCPLGELLRYSIDTESLSAILSSAEVRNSITGI